MKFTGERYVTELSGQIRLEHIGRYYFVIHQLDLTNKIVVDLASGEGYGSNLLANHCHHVFSIDINREAVSHARRKYPRENITFLQGDATRVPLATHSADVFVSFETIEHHDEHIEMLDEIKRVLKPDGFLVISSPDRYHYSDLPRYRNTYHMKELYEEEFKRLIASYFEICLYFSQRTIAGSIFAYDGEVTRYNKPWVVEKGGGGHDFTPLYNIAIASDTGNLALTYPFSLYKEFDYILTKEEMDTNIKILENSYDYKLGNLILRPLRWLRRILYGE